MVKLKRIGLLTGFGDQMEGDTIKTSQKSVLVYRWSAWTAWTAFEMMFRKQLIQEKKMWKYSVQ